MANKSKSPGLLFIFITLLLDFMGIGIIIPITPHLVAQIIGGDLSIASRYFGTLIALYTLMQFLCSPLLGALSDRYGRKPILLFSLLGSGISYLMTALAPNLGWLYAARVIGGSSAASQTAATGYIADVSTPENRAQSFGIIGAAMGLGFILGPALGGLLGSYSLKLPFVVSSAVAFLNFTYGLLGVPESHRLENRAPFTWDKANPFYFVKALKKYPLILGMVASILLVGLAQQCQQSNWVIANSLRFHWSTAENGFSLALSGICAALAQGGLIRLILPRLGEKRTILYGLGLCAIMLTLFGLASQGWMMYPLIIVSSLGTVFGPVTQGFISRQVGPTEQGTIGGSLTSLMSLTGIIGPIMANQLFATFTGPSAPIQIPGIAFFLAALLALLAFINMVRVLSQPAYAAEKAEAPV